MLSARFPIAFLPLAAAACLLAACSTSKPSAADEFYGTDVYLPNGKKILAEAVRSQTMMMRGMMFRDSLAPDRGMLFTHGEEGNFPYWMFQVRIPLDMLWLDSRRTVVEIVENAAPCAQKPCPSYGGTKKALYVLELAGGSVKQHNLRVGDKVRF